MAQQSHIVVDVHLVHHIQAHRSHFEAEGRHTLLAENSSLWLVHHIIQRIDSATFRTLKECCIASWAGCRRRNGIGIGYGIDRSFGCSEDNSTDRVHPSERAGVLVTAVWEAFRGEGKLVAFEDRKLRFWVILLVGLRKAEIGSSFFTASIRLKGVLHRVESMDGMEGEPVRRQLFSKPVVRQADLELEARIVWTRVQVATVVIDRVCTSCKDSNCKEFKHSLFFIIKWIQEFGLLKGVQSNFSRI